MAITIAAGRMRHTIQWLEQSQDSNEWGEPLGLVPVYEPLMADVMVRSGSESSNFGAELTDEVITVLVWYDPRVTNANYIDWNGHQYKIDHIKPDELFKGMIVTAKVQRDG